MLPATKKGAFQIRIIEGVSAPEELAALKQFISRIYSEAGYVNSPYKNIDLDPWSTWFYVTLGDQILSAMRIVEKKPENFIPLEQAIKHNSIPQIRYALLEDNVADWNSVAFERTLNGAKAAKINFAVVANYCIKQGFDMVYGMYNPVLEGIQSIYLEAGARVSERFPGPVYFPGFELKGELALLQIVEISKTTLHQIAAKV
ncbi:hypothetical protein EHO65_18305 [Leptospira andrefontaineae]|uniref:Uncharacterized protein n=1 Tax=Leptospira andrefontaineae TaxID=2484976 RepID=A0A4V3JFC6_9LEPT|nr:hypothetical protein EHO65_18305 [Leptospira andrefontaineae]